VNGDTVAALAAMLVVALAVFFGIIFGMESARTGDVGVFADYRWWISGVTLLAAGVGVGLLEDVAPAAVLFLVAAAVGAAMAAVGFWAVRVVVT
jgi:hypothetical protein